MPGARCRKLVWIGWRLDGRADAAGEVEEGEERAPRGRARRAPRCTFSPPRMPVSQSCDQRHPRPGAARRRRGCGGVGAIIRSLRAGADVGASITRRVDVQRLPRRLLPAEVLGALGARARRRRRGARGRPSGGRSPSPCRRGRAGRPAARSPRAISLSAEVFEVITATPEAIASITGRPKPS